ncbi:transposase [Mucilaginibacter sp. P25]|uniref:REP element-mobilizing transposase RayT n=1 Tax=Mucilaginibacter gossypii TaxID=551996 RepID=A0A1G8EBK0_9SPHI|nr:transposase [Mucilaginibacter gossypii]SDH67089.1 REP element-mobilizing transposase RayT [Mucilaginibacter gossypii]
MLDINLRSFKNFVSLVDRLTNLQVKISDNTYYHIYNRGNNKEPIFFENDNYIFFLNQFKKHVLPFCEVYAYCLMPNHFHFFIMVNDQQSFETGIKNFFISYSKAINKKYNRVGSLFQGRYKASEIDSDSYYTRIITYIHQNPVIANLVTDISDYKYSSYPAYLSAKKTVLNKHDVLEWFGGLEHFINDHKISVDERDIPYVK